MARRLTAVRWQDGAVPADLQDDWDALVRRTGLDPFFNSASWLQRWLGVHRGPHRLRPALATIEEGGRLVVATAWTQRTATHARWIRGTRLELLGNLWGVSRTAMSERMGLAVDPDGEPVWLDALLASVLDRPGWDDLLVPRVEGDSPTVHALQRAVAARGWVLRTVDAMPAYRLVLDDTFEGFLARLGPRTRLRVYNGRKKLAAQGAVEFWRPEAGSLDDFFSAFDRLHVARWGWPASRGLRGALYRELAEEQARRGELAASLLKVDGRPVSGVLNFVHGDTEYGVQAAFDPAFESKASVGALHTGYIIEDCYRRGLGHFDLLGGTGRSSDYKSHLGARKTSLVSLQVIRSGWLRAVYRAHATVRRLRTALIPRSGSQQAVERPAVETVDGDSQ